MKVTQTQIIELYIATFGRVADKTGLDYWTNSGFTIEQIAQSFFDQPETQTLNKKNNTDFIADVYMNTYGIEIPKEATQNWLTKLNNSTKPQIIQDMKNEAKSTNSQLFKNKVSVAQTSLDANINDMEVLNVLLDNVTMDIDTVSQATTSNQIFIASK